MDISVPIRELPAVVALTEALIFAGFLAARGSRGQLANQQLIVVFPAAGHGQVGPIGHGFEFTPDLAFCNNAGAGRGKRNKCRRSDKLKHEQVNADMWLVIHIPKTAGPVSDGRWKSNLVSPGSFGITGPHPKTQVKWLAGIFMKTFKHQDLQN